MPINLKSPLPKHFPCQIGIDFWMKKAPAPAEGKKKRKDSQIFYKYTDAPTDIEGWIDPAWWLPLPFDLCWLKTDIKTKTGWWTGKVWEGLRLKEKEKVFYWKRCTEDMGQYEINYNLVKWR